MANNTVGGNLQAPKTSLKDFQLYNSANPQPQLSDFQYNLDETVPVANVPSNANNAAYAAALSPDGTAAQAIVNSYKDALAESNTTGQSSIASGLVSAAQQQARQQNVDPLLDILSNPNLDDETKRKAVASVYDQSHSMYTPANMLTTKVLSRPVEGPANNEVDETRFNLSAITQEMNKNKADVQRVYNSAVSMSDPSLEQSVFTLGLNLVPGAKTYMLSKIRAAATDTNIVPAFIKTLFQGQGATIQQLRNHIASLPADQQLDAAQNMADIINQHSSILAPTPDDDSRRQFLQGVLGGEGYTSSDALADNLSTWIDLALVGGPLVKGGKLAYGAAKDVNSAVKATQGLMDGAAFRKSFEANYADLAKANAPGVDATANVASGYADASMAPKGSTYEKTTGNSLGQFQRSRETQFYDSSTGVPYEKLPKENVLSSAIRDGVRSQVQPTSIFQNYKDANPSITRGAFETINAVPTDDAARALAGTDRADAISSAMMPEVAHIDGSVSAKVAQVDALSQMRDAVPAELRDFLNRDGLTQYSQHEKAVTRSYKMNDFQSATGLTPRGEMFQYVPDMSRTTDTPQGFHFVGVYGPMNSGFSDAQDAMDVARFAMRNSGIDESAMTLLRRDGDRYIPTTLEEANAATNKDFLVSIDHDYRFNSRDVDSAIDADGNRAWAPLKVKMNFFDRILSTSGRGGTLASHLVDKGSQLDKLIVGSSVVGVDRAAGIEKAWLKQVGDIAVNWRKLPKDIQGTLLDELADANLNSRPYDYARLAARGIPAEGMDVLRAIQQQNDSVWFMKNQYFANQLDKAGYEEYVHVGSNTNLPVRALRSPTNAAGTVPRNAKDVRSVWNPVTDSVEHISKADLENLYQQNGFIGRLRQPIMTQAGDSAEHVIIRDTANDSFTRRFTPNSQVLNYRPGYYGVQYKEPWHIVERVADANGNFLYEKSVATAKDIPAAKTMANRMIATAPTRTLSDGTERYFYRKATEIDSTAALNAEYDVEQAQGMSSFRRRGQLLEDSSSNMTTMQSTHIANPIEVMVNQVRSMSQKLAMQDVIDAQARRGIFQYGQYLPKDRFGNPVIPTDLRQIGYKGGLNFAGSDVADARTSFGYVNYLQHGYANALDDTTKALFHMVADKFGELGLGKAEQASRTLGNVSLTNGLKSTSYYAYMATSPLHQIVLQGQQAAMLGALNPKWLASINAFSQPAYLSLRSLGMEATHSVAQQLAKTAWGSSAEAEAAFQQFYRTGLGAAVDHQNMVSGAVNDMAEQMISNSRQDLVNRALYVPRMLASTSRKVGFDAGEFYSSMMSWLAHRDLAAKQGLDVLDDAVNDTIHAQSRNYTGNMNAAGAMPQDKNALAFLFQYTSNQQKMLLNMITNRAIDPKAKVAMATLVTSLYGVGQWHAFDNAVAKLPNGDTREALQYGLEGWALNKMMGLATGGKSEIDWSSLSPVNAYGFLDMLHQMTVSPIGGLIANAPSTSLLFGNNPRIANAVDAALRYTHLKDDIQDPTTFLDVAHEAAKIMSGYSAYTKARYLMETRKKLSSSGQITDENLDKVNAIGTLLGFPTMTESAKYAMFQDTQAHKKDLDADIQYYLKQLDTHYSDPDLKGSDLELTQRKINEVMRVWGNDNAYVRQKMDQHLRAQVKTGDSALYTSILQNCQFYNKGDCMSLIDKAPFKNEQDRQDLKDLISYGNTFLPDSYNGKKEK